jgi:hypothetical protein
MMRTDADATPESGPDDKEWVWVYQYTYWDAYDEKQKTSKLYATVELIRNGLGVIVHTSGKQVRRDILVDGVLHPRIAT